jgi:hypothetical protein
MHAAVTVRSLPLVRDIEMRDCGMLMSSGSSLEYFYVMAGLVPVIYVFKKHMDARIESAHDG